MRHFFIVGSPRSGTTLLQAMLMRAEGVAIPPETKFLGITWAHRRYLGDLRTPGGWRRTVDAVTDTMRADEFGLDTEAWRARVDLGPRTYAALLNAWLDAVGEAQGAEIVGEKSPVHVGYVVELLAMCPGSRVVHIVRDPRDVATSQREAWGTTAVHAATRWRRDVGAHERYVRLLDPSVYQAIRYEDLVGDPRAVMAPLLAFLDLPFDERVLSPEGRAQTGFAARETHKQRTLQPVTARRAGRWERDLDPADVAVVETICAPLMAIHGYETSTAPGERVRGIGRAAAQVAPWLMEHARMRARLVRRRLDG